ncbi:MAG TPA: methyl-accepting chemotaxis protein [Xanthobacteraceae bacterium]|nr:methyl-accepting chemotaxis protein [Xanthobacteraceae bacterium]
MRFLDDLKISVKILSVIGLLSAITALVVILGAVSLHGVDQTYSQIVGKEDPAILAVARAARSANIIGYAAYRSIAYPGNSPQAAAAAKSVEVNSKNMLDFLTEAERLNPENKDSYDELTGKAQVINSCTASVVALGMKDQNDEATKAMVKCDETIGALTSTASNFSNAQMDKAKAATAAASSSATSTIIMTTAIGVIGLALCGALGLWIAMTKITKPLVRLGENMNHLADGDLTADIAGQERGDEVGIMAKAVQVFKDNALALKAAEEKSADQQRAAEEQRRLADDERRRNEAARAEAAEQVARVVECLGAGLERMAQGDLSYRLNDNFAAEYVKIRDDFNGAIGQLQQTISAIVSSTREVTNASAEISTSTTDLSQRTEEQAASLEQTSASMEEIASTVKKNAENAQQASQSANATRQVADRGGQVVAQAVEAMARIEESSRKIADIIGVIDEIARQTNLLALNAAVEAARAGEAGRGFAVVASEVRSLAQRSSQAAKDIKDLITNSNSQVKDGVDLVNKAGGALTEIVTSIKSVADTVAQIAAASAEQATGLEQVNKALTQMDEVTQQNSALVEENAATAKTLETQAVAMTEKVAAFRLGDGAENAGAARQASSQPVSAGRAPAPAARPAAKPAIKLGAKPAAKFGTMPAAANGRGGPVGQMQSTLATAIKDTEWEEF